MKRGGSPVLSIDCPDTRCAAPAGDYCRRPNGSVQIIAHAVRRRRYWANDATPPNRNPPQHGPGAEANRPATKGDTGHADTLQLPAVLLLPYANGNDSVHVHYEGDADDDWHEVTLPKPGDETG